ncbi:MAG: Mur ligase family protein [Chitinophagaceae bacterium]|jgi:UDP-N-acetylmuramate: L-alanyl-gamma-D-glutamyl-meso-diaminopimelate ligase
MKKTHFIAIGGAVMHQLALALHRQGHQVTGSDDEINDPAKSNLAAAGILPETNGWFPEKITKELDAIVLGMHARADNPELIAAQALGIPIYSFPEYVYEVSKNKKRVVVAGSHGKTSITSMIMHVLRHENIEFDYLVGAKLDGFAQSVQLSDAPLIILEGDEYPASVIEKKPKIFFYHPHISVLSGIAWDHINVFPTYENYCNQFIQYLQGMESGSELYYNAEDSEVNRIVGLASSHLHVEPYVTHQFHYEDATAVLATEKGDVPVSIFGRHNLLNLNAALKVCLSLGVAKENFYTAIASFTGAARRLEKIAEKPNMVVFRDFAHAPSKLKATLDAVKEAMPLRRVIACFELHTFSSLNEQFLSEYAHSMDAADISIVFFSHHALQMKGLPALDKEMVHSYFSRPDLLVIDNKDELEKKVKDLLADQSGQTCLLLMSSGTFDGIQWKF